MLILYSIIAVQGLGADPFYTWVKKSSATDNSRMKRCTERVLRWKQKQKKQGFENEGNGIIEIMWPRDLLLPLPRNTRIATYSYESDWMGRNVKTSLGECAEQFLNILFQYRQQQNVCYHETYTIGQVHCL